jgi:hypothetical protein
MGPIVPAARLGLALVVMLAAGSCAADQTPAQIRFEGMTYWELGTGGLTLTRSDLSRIGTASYVLSDVDGTDVYSIENVDPADAVAMWNRRDAKVHLFASAEFAGPNPPHPIWELRGLCAYGVEDSGYCPPEALGFTESPWAADTRWVR